MEVSIAEEKKILEAMPVTEISLERRRK